MKLLIINENCAFCGHKVNWVTYVANYSYIANYCNNE